MLFNDADKMPYKVRLAQRGGRLTRMLQWWWSWLWVWMRVWWLCFIVGGNAGGHGGGGGV
jgi:hypothetical protein